MRAVVQRVSRAAVTVNTQTVGSIAQGLVVLLGVHPDDDQADIDYLAGKTAHIRIFEDSDGKMNRSLRDIDGEALVIPQFTLYGDCRKGRRPSFSTAAAPDFARSMYDRFVAALRMTGIAVATGQFREMMAVSLINEGPVTLLLDSTRQF